MGNLKQQRRRERQKHLLSFFPEHSGYSELDLGDRVLVKWWDSALERWLVGEYTKDSFARYKAYREHQRLNREMQDRIDREY